MQVLGWILVSLPFIGLFVYSAITIGWKETSLFFCAAIAIYAILAAGVSMIKAGG